MICTLNREKVTGYVPTTFTCNVQHSNAMYHLKISFFSNLTCNCRSCNQSDYMTVLSCDHIFLVHQRLIVEFALEDNRALKLREQRKNRQVGVVEYAQFESVCLC